MVSGSVGPVELVPPLSDGAGVSAADALTEPMSRPPASRPAAPKAGGRAHCPHRAPRPGSSSRTSVVPSPVLSSIVISLCPAGPCEPVTTDTRVATCHRPGGSLDCGWEPYQLKLGIFGEHLFCAFASMARRTFFHFGFSARLRSSWGSVR